MDFFIQLFNFILQSTIESGLQSEVIQKPCVKPSGRQFRIGQIQRQILVSRQLVHEHPDQRRLTASRFCHERGEFLLVRRISQSADRIFDLR